MDTKTVEARSRNSDHPKITLNGRIHPVFWLVGIAVLIPVSAFFLWNAVTLDWLVDLGIVQRVRNGDYVVGRLVSAGLVFITLLLVYGTRNRCKVSEGGIEAERGFSTVYSASWNEQIRITSRHSDSGRMGIEIVSLKGSWFLSSSDFPIRRLRDFYETLYAQLPPYHCSLSFEDKLGWIEQEKEVRKRWYRQPWFRSIQGSSAVLIGAALMLCVTYYDCWIRPSGVGDELYLVVTSIGQPQDRGWWENDGYYGMLDPNYYQALYGESYQGEVDASDIEVLLFDPNVWSFQPGDTCRLEIARTAMIAGLFMPRNGYYIKDVLLQVPVKVRGTR